jgi:hypothetical protein
MRKFLLGMAVLAALLAAYVGSAAMNLAALADAVRSRNTQAVAERVDLDRVRQSLVAQIVAAYLQSVGQTKRVSSRDQWVANSVGSSVADAMLAKVLVPENITRILNEGNLPASEDRPEITLPKFAELNLGNAAETLGRIRLVNSGEFAVRLNKEGQEHSGIRMRFQGTDWRLSAIDLPPSVLRTIVDKLPKPTA